MAKVKGVATLKDDGYKNLHCLFCGYFIKAKISPIDKSTKLIKCDRCKTKHKLEYIESDGEFTVNFSVSTSDKTYTEPELYIL